MASVVPLRPDADDEDRAASGLAPGEDAARQPRYGLAERDLALAFFAERDLAIMAARLSLPAHYLLTLCCRGGMQGFPGGIQEWHLAGRMGVDSTRVSRIAEGLERAGRVVRTVQAVPRGTARFVEPSAGQLRSATTGAELDGQIDALLKVADRIREIQDRRMVESILAEG